MNKESVTNFVNAAKDTAMKHSPEILTAIGIAGMISATVLAVRSTPKALRLLDEAENKKNEELTVPEKVKACWKCYIPATVTGAASIACLIGANSVNAKRNAALATAYKLSETALSRYKDAVIETVGEKKEQAIQDKMAEKHIQDNPIGRNEVIITDKGDTLCYDTISGRYFKSDIDKIKRALNEVNNRMLSDNYIALNDFYEEIGLSFTSMGDELGWSVYDGLLDIHFSAQIAEENKPCVVINFDRPPKHDYSKFV